jgi:deoxyribonuclease-4
MIRIGPAGIGGMKEAPRVLEKYNKHGINAAEIPFTYQIWMSNEQAKEIRKIAKKFDVELSIHAPYWINLNSADERKQEQSKKRILDSCERAHYLGAKYVVFHSGFYGKDDKEKTYQAIKEAIINMQKVIKKSKWDVKLAPETMGKINVFGSVDEIFRLVKETKCSFCFDFAHIKAYSLGKMSYEEMCKRIKKLGHIHAHFSGIEYASKGERNHKITPEKEIKELLNALKKNGINDITIINESPGPFGDCLKTKKILETI